MDELSKEVSDVMSKRLQIDKIEKENDWDNEFGSLDSLDMVDLMFALEEHFHVKFSDKFETMSFRSIVDFITRYRSSSSS
jgi:acyl carrier protein